MAPPDSTGDGGGADLPDDVVADILDSARRRRALEVLLDRDRPVVIDDLAAAVCARERDATPGAVSESERREVRDEFFQRHLPKLTATEVVSYDSMLGTVELTRPAAIRDALEDD